MITFPLVFGWIHFETVPGDMSLYQVYIFGFPAGAFRHNRFSGSSFFMDWSGRPCW